MRRKMLIVSTLALCVIVLAGWCYIYWCRAIVVDEDLNGLVPEQVIARYGQPNGRNVFILTDTLLEYRYGLLSIFPQYRDSSIEIMEMMWIDSSWTRAIWFRKDAERWKSVDNLWWARRIQF